MQNFKNKCKENVSMCIEMQMRCKYTEYIINGHNKNVVLQEYTSKIPETFVCRATELHSLCIVLALGLV